MPLFPDEGPGLFVDLDGTLADSLGALRAAYLAFLAEAGVAGSDAEFDRLNGPPLPRIVAHLKAVHGLAGAPAVLLERYDRHVQAAHAAAPPMPDAARLLGCARERGRRVAVVTSAPGKTARRWLTGAHLAPLVDAVIGGDEVRRGKPAPDPYQLALARLGCAASRSLAVEDSRTGAAAAVAAGLPTWVIAPPEERRGWPAGVGCVARLSDLLGRL